jgi:diguanylate cyclase
MKNKEILNSGFEETVSTKDPIRRAQRLRLKRFGMSVATYLVAILATFLITRLGIGELSLGQWRILIGWCLLGIGLFFVLFYTNMNLRFPEPSLTREQIVYSSIYGIMVMHWVTEARPMVLLFLLPPFSFGVLSLTLRQYFSVVGCIMGLYTALLGYEYLQNPQGFNLQYQLFLFVLFGLLLIWFAFFGGFVSNIRRRLREQKKELKIEMEERRQAQAEKDKLIVELKNALAKVNTLNQLLPICSHCKKVRDDKGYWDEIEEYIYKHSDTEFSHSICPECVKKLYPDLDIPTIK